MLRVTTIADAVTALRAGRLVGFPTDTVYGIGADPFSADAMAALGRVKGRPEAKPVAVLVGSLEQAARLAVITEAAAELAVRFWPGPLTLVLRRSTGVPDWIGDAAQETVGVRFPDHAVTAELLAAAGPVAATSANLAGDPPELSAAGAAAMFGDRVACYLPGTAPGGDASTVLDLSGDIVRVLRPGPVPWPAT